MAANSALSELGRSGLDFSAGMVNEEVLPDLTSDRAVDVFTSMSENDSVIGGILFAIDMMLRQVEWTVEPHPDGDDEDVEFLQGCMDDMSHSWSDFISEVLSMLVFGWSYFEIVYKRRNGPQKSTNKIPGSKFTDGRIGWRKFAIRSQDSLQSWDFNDEDGSVKAFVQRCAPDYKEVTIPIEKSLLFRTRAFKGNPEGRSILRTSYRSWYFKKRMEEIEGVGIERDLAGLPFVKIDKDILNDDSPDAKALVGSVRNIIRNVRQDKEAGVIWPMIRDENGEELLTFELMSSGGTRSFDITNIIERYDNRIAMSVLADFIMLGHQAVGSYALSSDKTSLFAVALGAWLKGMEDVINRYAVTRLWELNGMDTTNMPRITHKDIEKPDLALLTTFMATLAQIGMPLFPDEALEKHLREVAGLPPQSEEAGEEAEQKELEELGEMLQGLGIERPPDDEEQTQEEVQPEPELEDA